MCILLILTYIIVLQNYKQYFDLPKNKEKNNYAIIPFTFQSFNFSARHPVGWRLPEQEGLARQSQFFLFLHSLENSFLSEKKGGGGLSAHNEGWMRQKGRKGGLRGWRFFAKNERT